ncbi:MAG: diaminopimelate decarboxylase [Chloroflexi bacterium]|nr:diaminopimelate decarboxylase [Chloroflexota bacterium]
MKISEFPFYLWPISTHLYRGRLYLREWDLANLADKVGTPLYVYDFATIDTAIAAYRAGLRAWPGATRLAYAAKAWWNRGLARFLQKRGLEVDVVSEGELGIAVAASFPPQQVHVHGNNKSPAFLRQAMAYGVGAIVVDNLDELVLLEHLAEHQPSPPLWLRLNPDLLAPTHPYRQTGHIGSKFGLTQAEARQAAERIHRHPGLQLVGLHTHIGSQIFDLEPLLAASRSLIQLAVEIEEQGWGKIESLCPGGGLGVSYHPQDERLSLSEAVQRLAAHSAKAWEEYHGGPHPTLVLEPGRSLIARAGIALYRVGAIKHLPDATRLIAVDGSMADNPRVALYGARYTASLPAAPLAPIAGPARIVGPLCESGDILISQLEFPSTRVGDILAMPVAGAYQLSMASNYNMTLRPPVYALTREGLFLMQRRETVSDLLQREEWTELSD